VPDFGFYARDTHSTLIRENRLIAGVNFLDELTPALSQLARLIEAVPKGTTFDDAEARALASGAYSRHQPAQRLRGGSLQRRRRPAAVVSASAARPAQTAHSAPRESAEGTAEATAGAAAAGRGGGRGGMGVDRESV
jgi:hypothetical protein